MVIRSFFYLFKNTTDFPNDLRTSISEKEVETVAKAEKTYVEENSGTVGATCNSVVGGFEFPSFRRR